MGDKKVNTEPVAETSYELQDLTVGTKYVVSVETIGKDNLLSEKTSVEFTTDNPVQAPTPVTVSDITETSASVSWDAVEGITGYYVFLNGERKNAEPVADTSYALTDLTAGTEYTVAVQAVREDGKVSAQTEQTLTTVASAVVIPKPENIKADNVAQTIATISWDATEGALGYNVYVGNEKVNTELVTKTSYTLKDLTAGTKYVVSVETVSKYGITSEKATIEFTTLADEKPVPPNPSDDHENQEPSDGNNGNSGNAGNGNSGNKTPTGNSGNHAVKTGDASAIGGSVMMIAASLSTALVAFRKRGK